MEIQHDSGCAPAGTCRARFTSLGHRTREERTSDGGIAPIIAAPRPRRDPLHRVAVPGITAPRARSPSRAPDVATAWRDGSPALPPGPKDLHP